MKCGGWMVNPEMKAVELPEGAGKAFKDVVAKMDGKTEYVPVLYAGWQLVSGLNHLFICKTRKKGETEWTSVVQMRVYAPLSGSAELSEMNEIIF